MAREPRMPAWLNRCLQGLVYWLGYQSLRQFGKSKIPEAAVGVAFSDLLYAELPNDRYVVDRERMYREVLNGGGWDQERVDLLVYDQLEEDAHFLIEVKRAGNTSLIEKDVDRLAKAIQLAPEYRGLLLVASEGKRPRNFVTKKGMAIQKNQTTSKGHVYRVRRVCKVTSSFKIKAPESAHYVCLIEVIK